MAVLVTGGFGLMEFRRKTQGLSSDGRMAREEWGWKVEYSLPGMVPDFYAELKAHPERYR